MKKKYYVRLWAEDLHGDMEPIQDGYITALSEALASHRALVLWWPNEPEYHGADKRPIVQVDMTESNSLYASQR